MNGNVMGGIVSVLTAIVGVAMLAVIFAPRANTANVVRASGGALADAINAATAPVSSGYSLRSSSVGIGAP